MDDALVVRDDLRSYALRRCIRFYTAVLVACITWTATMTNAQDAGARMMILLGGALLLAIIAAVEVGAMVVMIPMAQARRRIGGGPETPLWAFAQGPWPSLLAAALFALAAWGLVALADA